MKKIVILALLWVSVSACTRDKEAVPEATGPVTTAAYRQQTLVKAPDTDLNLKVVEVRDSRCPMDGICIWAGKAEVDFTITDGTNQTSVSATLEPGNQKPASVKFSLSNKNYLLHLREVLPYPKSSEKPDVNDYKVNVSIQNN